MAVGHSTQDLVDEVSCHLLAEVAGDRNLIVEFTIFAPLHDEIVEPAFVEDLVQPADVWVVQFGQEVHLVLEPRVFVVRQLVFLNDLDGPGHARV